MKFIRHPVFGNTHYAACMFRSEIEIVSVQDGFFEPFPGVAELQRKEGDVAREQVEKDPVSLPLRERPEHIGSDPGRYTLVGSAQLPGKTVCVEEMHVFGLAYIGYESDDTPVPVGRESEPGLFEYLAEHAVLGALPLLEFSSEAYPLPLIRVDLRMSVIFPFPAAIFVSVCTVEEEIIAAAFYIAKRRVYHLSN